MPPTPPELRRVDLSPDSHFRISLAKLISAAVILVGGTYAAVEAYDALKGDIHTHVIDPAKHLPDRFWEQHGAPQGYWDLKVRDDAFEAYQKATELRFKRLEKAEDVRDEIARRRR